MCELVNMRVRIPSTIPIDKPISSTYNNTEVMSLFKDRLREARLNRQMTQAELAARIGVVKSTIAGYEAGRSEPDMEKFALIMSALNVDANSLLRDEMNGEQIGRVVPTDEAHLIALKFDELDEHGKQMIRLVIEAERNRTV